jgi:hypothetical protein
MDIGRPDDRLRPPPRIRHRSDRTAETSSGITSQRIQRRSWHSGQAHLTGFNLAEWLCRTADRVDPPRVPGSHHRFLARSIYAGNSSGSADRSNQIAPHPRQTPGLRFRYIAGSLQSRGRCRALSRTEGRARRGFSYRGAGKVRRRIRRLVRSRFFNNARTATRNLDLPLIIGDPHLFTAPLLHRRILASAWRPQRGLFFGIRRCVGGFFILGRDFRAGRGHGFLWTRASPEISANL